MNFNYQHDSDDEVIIHCPHCPEGKTPKMYVNTVMGVFNCFRCGFSGRSLSVLRRYPSVWNQLQDRIDVGLSKRLSFEDSIHTGSDLISEITPFRELQTTDPEYIYLRNRGWSPALIDNYNPLVSEASKYKGRVILPVYADTGALIYYTGRDITGNSVLKYRNPEVRKDFIFRSRTGYDSIYPEDCFIGEGYFSMAKVPKAVALFGKTLKREQHDAVFEAAKTSSRIYICLDPNTEYHAKRLASELNSWFPLSDIYIMNWVSEKELETDLGDVSKSLSPAELVDYIKLNSYKFL